MHCPKTYDASIATVKYGSIVSKSITALKTTSSIVRERTLKAAKAVIISKVRTGRRRDRLTSGTVSLLFPRSCALSMLRAREHRLSPSMLDQAELLKTVVEDLTYLKDEWDQNIDDAAIRRGSTVLRRLLVNGELQRAWRRDNPLRASALSVSLKRRQSS
jgi:hypothetical protein